MTFDLSVTLKTLQVERVQVQKELAKLDKAIAVLGELSSANSTPNGHPKKRTMSAAARKKIADAQKLRWANAKKVKGGAKSKLARSLGGVMERIEVENLTDGEFRVRVIDGKTESSHRVTVNPEHYNRLTLEKIKPEELVKRSFEFLLKREPKESILPQFALRVIGRYFPEYEREIKRML